MPKILLINDDGINSPGLLKLKSELEGLGELLIVAPENERSGIGKALSSSLVKVKQLVLADGSKAYVITGTPADAFMLAKYKLLGENPDLLVAGINLGPNLGIDDFFTSGTLGAAIEAAIHGVPAIAVSYCIEKLVEGQDKASLVDMEALKLTAKIAAKTAEYLLKHGMPFDIDIISINVPEKVGSVDFEITTLSYKGYIDLFVQRKDGYIIGQWILADYPDDVKGTDIYAVKKRRRISITPIKLRFIHNTEGIRKLIDFLDASFQ
ncbi:MAG TPA: 5'/3'-nucleotidase SurE [Candidatus Bathyarchaeota archaeon]|nr:5'/3'-nucleotidase SurE [Candidatus Bathyarchaeota archaeon]